MQNTNLIISPKTRVGELLDKYPDLEEEFLSISPLFANLKNPVLRRTIARVATLQQVSVIGDLSVEELVNRLRKAAGQTTASFPEESMESLSAQQPDWMHQVNIVVDFDATSMINSGQSPLAVILKLVKTVAPGSTLLLRTPFVPAPIVDKLKQEGFYVWVAKSESACLTYVYSPLP